MARLIWTEPALLDLEEIADYIAIDNVEAAKRLVKKVFASVARLKKFPESGRRPPELGHTRYREVIIGPCRIFYRKEGNAVFMLFVMRGEQLLRRFLLEGRARDSLNEPDD
jgi:toxin ParE1/3/4